MNHEPIADAFMSRLLAPLPADVEQVDTQEQRQLIEQDKRRIWGRGMERVRVAAAAQTITAFEMRSVREPMMGSGPKAIANRRAVAEWERTVFAQCLIPAPSPVEMRWKKRVTKHHSPPAEVLTAIAADERRFAGGLD